MSGRDLLYKPQVPTYSPEDEAPATKKTSKVGVEMPRGRDLGGVPGDKPAGLPAKPPPTAPPGRPRAYQAAYFNKDTAAVHQANQRASGMQALRGSAEALDLKKIVLPPAPGVGNPEPEQLMTVGELMSLDGRLELNLENLLGRQGAWARGEGVTVELIQARLAQLEAMVAARRAALARMLRARSSAMADSATLTQAVTAQGNALEETDDLVAEGRGLIGRTAEQAEGMHRRLAKILGIKRTVG